MHVSIIMTPKLWKRLGLADWQADITTVHFSSEVIADASESWKMLFNILYVEHLSPFQELVMLVVPMQVYNMVLGLHWVQCRKPDVD